MVVGSRAGSSAHHGLTAFVGATSSGNTQPVPSSSSTSTAPMSANADAVRATVHPVHHFTSAAVAGPYDASQRRTSSARAASAAIDGTPPGNHASMGSHRYWLLVHEPVGRPRTTRCSVESRNSTRVVNPEVPAHVLPSP